jgi:hypothetical protein
MTKRAKPAAPPKIPQGTVPADPDLTIYQRDIAPAIKTGAEACFALQTQGKPDLAASLYGRIATLMTLARRIFQRQPTTEEIRAHIRAETRALYGAITTITEGEK